ncbi:MULTISPECIES: hypothetical protein [unclassified Bradyrhizobium]
MPITAARRTYSAIAVRPIPTDREITRSLTPQAYFRRRTSRIFRIGNLSAGIGPPIASTAKGGTLPRSDCRQRPPSHPINRVAAFVRIGWPLSIGIGGRLPSESMAALPRIPHEARVIFYYGIRSLPRPYSLIGAELNDHFGFAVYDLVETANAYFRQKLHELLERI